jgi:hypothetical protein
MILIGLCASVQAQTIGFWQFNEKSAGEQADGTAGAILDSSGNGHHGTAVGDPLPSYVASANNLPSAIGLTVGNTVEDRIEIPHSADFNLMLADLQDYTIEAIVKLAEEQSYSPGIVAKRDTTGVGWTFRVEPSGTVGLYIQGTGLNFTYPEPQGTTSILDNKWHHVAAVINANADPALASVTFYVDHVADATVLITDTIYNNGNWVNENIVNTHDVWIGDFIGRTEDQFVGAIDAVRFSRGALAPNSFLPFTPDTTPPEPINVVHIGATDPTTEGFELVDEDGESTWSDGGTTPVSGRLQELSDSVAYYQVNGLSAIGLALPSGWTATATMKLNSNDKAWNACVAVEDGQDAWVMSFLSSPDAGFYKSGDYNTELGEFVATELGDVDPTVDFLTYQMYYNPGGDEGNGIMTFYVDGEEVGTQTRDEAFDSARRRFLFGDNVSFGGSATDTYWAEVRLESGNHVLGAGFPGDANHDGEVDDKDASILGSNWLVQSGATWDMGDFNRDGKVNDADAAILAAHWGQTAGEGAVPEPSLFVMLGMGGLTLFARRRRRRPTRG